MSRKRKSARGSLERLGRILIGAGLVANEWLLRLCSPDKTLEPSTRWLIRVFDLLAVITGLALVLWGRRVAAWVRRARRSAAGSRLAGPVISLGVTLALLGAAEAVCGYLNHARAGLTETRTPAEPFVVDDPVLGYALKPNARVRVVLRRSGGQVIYDVRYTFDGFGRRVTPAPGPTRRAQRALLCFGDSLTLGEGVNDDQTLPAALARALPGTAVYNYGVKGYGPHQVLAKLEEGGLRQQTGVRRAALIYTFIDDHVSRAIGAMIPYAGWAANAPYYALEGDRLVRRGSFKTGRGWPNAAYELFGRSQVLKCFRVDLPPVTTDRHLRLVCRMLEAARDRFAEQMQSDGFYVVCYPGATLARRLVPMLRARGISVVDYADWRGWDEAKYRIPYDGHPTPEAYRVIAARLVQDLGLAAGPAARR